MVNLKRISNSAFTLLALCVAQRLMAQQPFWLPVLAPELGLADKQTAITDGNSLFLNSTEDKLELLFIAELSTKSSSEDDSKEVDTYSEADSLLSSDEQQEKNEDKKNELSASSAFDHLGEQAAPAVDIALPYAAGLFASWLMKLDSSMGMLTAKSITAGLAYVGHHLGQGKNDEGGGGSSDNGDTYPLALWFDAPGSSVDAFTNAIQNIVSFNNNNEELQIETPLVYARNPYLTGDNPDSNYKKIYLPENLSTILTEKASSLTPGFYFDIGSFQCEKSPEPDPGPSKDCVPYTSQYAPAIPKIQAELNVWGDNDNKENIAPIQSALSWAYDFHQQYNQPFEFVIDPEAKGVKKEVVTNILQYMQDFISSNSNGDSLKDDVKVGVTLGLDQGEQTSLYITGKDNIGNSFPDPIKGNVYIQAYDADWNYWLRGYDEALVEMEDAADNLYNMMKLITCLTPPDDNSECYTNLPIVPLSDSHFGGGYRTYTLNKTSGIVYDLTVKGIDIQDFPYIPAYQKICTSFAEADSFIFNFHKPSGAQSSPSDVFKATYCNYDQDSLELKFKIPDTAPSKPDNLYFSQVEVDFSGIKDESHAKQVKLMFSFDTVSQSYKDESGDTQSVVIPFFKKVDPSTFNQFLDQFYTSSMNDNNYSIFDSELKLTKDNFAVYQYSTLLNDHAGWFPSADDADLL